MGDTGLEHLLVAPLKTVISQNLRAESGALGDKIRDSESDLSWLVERWPKLPDPIKQRVMELIRNAVPGKERTL